MTILGTTVEGNQGQDGGGVENAGDEMWIINSTISGNTAIRFGGGLHVRDGSVFIVNATIARQSEAVSTRRSVPTCR